MVRFNNSTVSIYKEVTEIDEDGDTINEFSLVETIDGDVQPHALTEDELKVYGLSSVRGNVRLFLYNGFHENIKAGNRAKVVCCFIGTEEWFNIMPVNVWSKHGECLLIPIENEVFEEEQEEENGEGE